MELAGRVALVTGAGHRLGKAIALELAQAGAHVVVHYGRSAEAARETVNQIAALGVEAMPAQADLAVPEQIESLFTAVAAGFGGLDVLVNSAASFRRQAFDEIDVADWDQVMAVNLRAPFLCTQKAARLMRAGDRQSAEPALIVNMADLSGVHVWPGYAPHGVSKAAILHLTRVSAAELAPDIRVNAIVPGPILPPPGMSAEGDAWQRLGRSVPLGRAGQPAEVGKTVMFLAENDFVTGVIVHVDGGEHLSGRRNR